MKTCSRCILPDTYPGIEFDAEGVCNHCLSYRPRVSRGEEKLREIIDSYRGRNAKYDCIVAYSGGRDSSYLLWYATQKLGLKVLACFVDNGYAPEQTLTNIRNATEALGIDLVIRKHGYVRKCVRHTLKSWIRRPDPGMIGLLCAGCNFALRYYLLEMAREHKVPLVLFGLGEPEPETTFAEKLLMSNPHKKLSKVSLGLGFASRIAANPSYLSNPGALSVYMKEYIFRWAPFLRKMMTKKVAYPEMRVLEPFYYIDWDEDEIVSVIHDKLNWEKCTYSGSSWRTDCEIATFKNYLYKQTIGFSKLHELLSNMIRCDMTTREKAIARVEKEGYISEDFIRGFLEEAGLDYQAFQSAMAGKQGD